MGFPLGIFKEGQNLANLLLFSFGRDEHASPQRVRRAPSAHSSKAARALRFAGDLLKRRSAGLAPATINEDIAVTRMSIAGRYPNGVRTGWCFPSARIPSVGISIPTMIAGNPYMVGAGANAPDFYKRSRWADSYHSLRLKGTDSNGNPKKRGQQ